jgi:hypothetical protein
MYVNMALIYIGYVLLDTIATTTLEAVPVVKG